MKKTLVALAAVAATSAAFAEVKISGTVDLGYTMTKSTTAAGASSTINGVGNGINGQDALYFGVSEDLGDGMTAYANVNFQPTTDIATGPAQDSGSGLGLRGAFGNVFLGRTWDAVMTGVVFAQPNYGNIQGLAVAHTGMPATGLKSNTISYTLPSLVSGLSVTVQKAHGETSDGAGNSNTWAIGYTVGAFTATVAGTKEKEAAIANAWGSALDGGVGAETFAAGSTTSVSAFALSYDLGMAKLFASSITHKNNTDSDLKIANTTMGVTIPFGANTVYLTSDTANHTLANTNTNKDTGMRIALTHDLSKRTRAFFVNGSIKRGNSTLSQKQTAVGLQHSF